MNEFTFYLHKDKSCKKYFFPSPLPLCLKGYRRKQCSISLARQKIPFFYRIFSCPFGIAFFKTKKGFFTFLCQLKCENGSIFEWNLELYLPVYLHFCLYATHHVQNSHGSWKTELPDGPGIPNSEDTYKYCGTCTDLLEK